PAAIALRSSCARSCVVAASKNTVSSGLFSAASRSVVNRVSPCALASAASFSELRPTRMGSGMTRSPFLSATPPWARIAAIDGIRCWFMPMRPVTPFMMRPRRCCAIAFSLSVHSEKPVDAPGVIAKRFTGLHVEAARVRQVHAEIVRHAGGSGGKHDHPRREKHRLGDAVGAEHDRLFGFLPDLQQLEGHLLAGHA